MIRIQYYFDSPGSERGGARWIDDSSFFSWYY